MVYSCIAVVSLVAGDDNSRCKTNPRNKIAGLNIFYAALPSTRCACSLRLRSGQAVEDGIFPVLVSEFRRVNPPKGWRVNILWLESFNSSALIISSFYLRFPLGIHY